MHIDISHLLHTPIYIQDISTIIRGIKILNHKWKLLAIMASVFLIGFLLEEMIDSSKLNDFQSLEETIEIISELFSVFVALSIFGITWYAYNKSRDNHSLFLGTTFLITGFLILFHLLSYPFMPDLSIRIHLIRQLFSFLNPDASWPFYFSQVYMFIRIHFQN